MGQICRKDSSLRRNSARELKSIGDDELLDEFKSGNAQAFEEIFDRYHKPIYNLCLRMLGNVEEASDLTQETFAKAFKAFPGMGEVKIFSWLYRVATNLNLDHFRKSKFIFRRSGTEFDFSSIVDLSRDSNPAEVAEQAETRSMVWNAMMKLPPKYKMILNFREMQSLSYAEIADVMQISVAAVESLLHRARTKFKKVYEKIPEGRERGSDCKRMIPLLSPYFDGELEREKRRDVEEHLKSCSLCSGRYGELNRNSNLFKFIPLMAAPPALKSSLFTQLGISSLAGATTATAGTAASAAAGSAAGIKAAGVTSAGKLAIGGAVTKAVVGAGAAKVTASVAAIAVAGALTATVVTHPSLVKKAEEMVVGRSGQSEPVPKSTSKSSIGYANPKIRHYGGVGVLKGSLAEARRDGKKEVDDSIKAKISSEKSNANKLKNDNENGAQKADNAGGESLKGNEKKENRSPDNSGSSKQGRKQNTDSRTGKAGSGKSAQEKPSGSNQREPKPKNDQGNSRVQGNGQSKEEAPGVKKDKTVLPQAVGKPNQVTQEKLQIAPPQCCLPEQISTDGRTNESQNAVLVVTTPTLI